MACRRDERDGGENGRDERSMVEQQIAMIVHTKMKLNVENEIFWKKKRESVSGCELMGRRRRRRRSWIYVYMYCRMLDITDTKQGYARNPESRNLPSPLPKKRRRKYNTIQCQNR